MTKRPHRRTQPMPKNLAEAMRRIEEAHRNKEIKLSLEYLYLTELPDSIGELSQLRDLHLQGNHLATLPESITRLSQLQELHLYGN